MSDYMLWSFSCQSPSKRSGMSTYQNTTGKCPVNSQRASRHVDDVSNMRQTLNWKNRNILGWKRGAIHEGETDEGINLERRDLKALKANAFVHAVNKNTDFRSRIYCICLLLPPAWYTQALPLAWMFWTFSRCCECVWQWQSPDGFFICERQTPENGICVFCGHKTVSYCCLCCRRPFTALLSIPAHHL